MPHTIKIFDSDNEDHQRDLMLRNKATDMAIAFHEINNLFREHLKYNKYQLSEKQIETIDKFHEQFKEIIEDKDIPELV